LRLGVEILKVSFSEPVEPRAGKDIPFAEVDLNYMFGANPDEDLQGYWRFIRVEGMSPGQHSWPEAKLSLRDKLEAYGFIALLVVGLLLVLSLALIGAQEVLGRL